MSDVKSDEPQIPDEVMRRGKIALTQLASEEAGVATLSVPGWIGAPGDLPEQEKPKRSAPNRDALIRLAYTPPGYEPCEGLSAVQINKIMALNYPGQPPMDPYMGDFTPEFVVWMYENQPRDAHVRYFQRITPNLAVWMSKIAPDFVYVPSANLKAQDFTARNTIDREIDTVESLRDELAKLRAAKATPPEANAEIEKLRAEIAAEKEPTAPIVTRRPRK